MACADEPKWVGKGTMELICYLHDGWAPRIRPADPQRDWMDAAPELADAFAQWSRSRDAFQEHVRLTQPTAPADRWQKLYYRGLQPDGSPGAPDHEATIRACPFTPSSAGG